LQLKINNNNNNFISEVGSAYAFWQRSTYPGGPLRTSYFQLLGTTEAGNFLKYAIENESSPRAVIEKRVSEN
jgi:hypothetical protein